MEKNVGKISGISTTVDLVGKISGISTDPTYTLVHVYNSRDSTDFYKKTCLVTLLDPLSVNLNVLHSRNS